MRAVDIVFVYPPFKTITRASQLASKILLDAPTVYHTFLSSADSIITLTIEPVPEPSFTTLTL